jgi:hypothetical protein
MPAPEPQPAPDPDQIPTPEPTTPAAAPHPAHAEHHADHQSEHAAEAEPGYAAEAQYGYAGEARSGYAGEGQAGVSAESRHGYAAGSDPEYAAEAQGGGVGEPRYGFGAESRSEYVSEEERLEGGWEMVPGLSGRSDGLLGMAGGDAGGLGGDPDDEVPTGFVPVVEDDEPTGVIEAVGYDDASEDGPHLQDSAGGTPGGGDHLGGDDAIVGGAGVAAVAGMVGLGLIGGGEPRVVPEAGSIEEAMRSEVERPRPRLEESDAEQALRDWCRARTKIVPSGFTIQVQVLDPNAPSYRFDLEPPEVDDPEYAADKLSDLLGDLWLTEAQGEQGGWLFARIDAAGRTVRIDRWYDQVPDWWDNPVEERLDVNGLVRRLYNRGPQWQPTYLEKLYTSAR